MTKITPHPMSHKTMPAKWRIGFPYPIGPRTEDPIRIKLFTETLAALSWKHDSQRTSLVALFNALSDLVHAELRYYYKRRCDSRFWSRIFRFFSWLFGSIGILIPVVKTAWIEAPENFLSFGYIFFTLAGTLIVADSVFSGSDAHSRYTTAQLKVEQIYSAFALEWQQLMIEFDTSPSQASGVPLIDRAIKFSETLHRSLESETEEWNISLKEIMNTLKDAANNPSTKN